MLLDKCKGVYTFIHSTKFLGQGGDRVYNFPLASVCVRILLSWTDLYVLSPSPIWSKEVLLFIFVIVATRKYS